MAVVTRADIGMAVTNDKEIAQQVMSLLTQRRDLSPNTQGQFSPPSFLKNTRRKGVLVIDPNKDVHWDLCVLADRSQHSVASKTILPRYVHDPTPIRQPSAA